MGSKLCQTGMARGEVSVIQIALNENIRTSIYMDGGFK